jgi:hypothetical protein
MEDKPHYIEDLNHFFITARIHIAQELDDAKQFMNHCVVVKFVRAIAGEPNGDEARLADGAKIVLVLAALLCYVCSSGATQ